MTDPVHRRAVARAVAHRLGISTDDADRVVAATFDAIADELAAGRPVVIRGFGVFEARPMPPRTRILGGTEIHVAARVKPAFRSSDALKQRLNQEE